jgi:HD-GYP domain-containing protein (c-di-GMP phosphodiesterase class II)
MEVGKKVEFRDELESEREFQELSSKIITGISAVESALHVYEPANDIITKLVTDLQISMQEFLAKFGENVSFQIKGNNYFLNKNLLKMEFKAFQRAKEIALIFQRLSITEITFPHDIDIEKLRHFFSLFFQAQRDDEVRAKLFKEPVMGIELKKIKGTVKTSVILEKDKLCFKLYSILKVLITEFLLKMEQIEPVFLIRVKRMVQLLIDNVHNSEGILLMLTMSRGNPSDVPEHLLKCAILSLIFGKKMGLNKIQLLHLTIASLFHDAPKFFTREREIAENRDIPPDYYHKIVIQNLLRLKSLGEDSLIRIIVCYENRDDFKRKFIYSSDLKLSAYSRIIAVADEFLNLLDQSYLPAEAIQLLVSKSREKLDHQILALFIKFMGTFPVGSLVLLSTNETAVVINNFHERERLLTPVVRIVSDRNGRSVAEGKITDLSQERSARIIRAVNADKYNINTLDFFKSSVI